MFICSENVSLKTTFAGYIIRIQRHSECMFHCDGCLGDIHINYSRSPFYGTKHHLRTTYFLVTLKVSSSDNSMNRKKVFAYKLLI